MLNQIQTLLVTNEIMTDKNLATKLGVELTALQGMLKLLLKREQIELVVGGECEGSCGCVNAKVHAYRWLEKKSQSTPLSIISVS
ncbi:MAG: FeoC-like transcriptional regulator [Thalassotalea sp.]|nr:FeoC-like transcriptional regulator [Thalassotalea sp.]MDG2394316.1 FeoC-like transcriptional regulator [Thalassotalea sp.]